MKKKKKIFPKQYLCPTCGRSSKYLLAGKGGRFRIGKQKRYGNEGKTPNSTIRVYWKKEKSGQPINVQKNIPYSRTSHTVTLAACPDPYHNRFSRNKVEPTKLPKQIITTHINDKEAATKRKKVKAILNKLRQSKDKK